MSSSSVVFFYILLQFFTIAKTQNPILWTKCSVTWVCLCDWLVCCVSVLQVRCCLNQPIWAWSCGRRRWRWPGTLLGRRLQGLTTAWRWECKPSSPQHTTKLIHLLHLHSLPRGGWTLIHPPLYHFLSPPIQKPFNHSTSLSSHAVYLNNPSSWPLVMAITWQWWVAVRRPPRPPVTWQASSRTTPRNTESEFGWLLWLHNPAGLRRCSLPTVSVQRRMPCVWNRPRSQPTVGPWF